MGLSVSNATNTFLYKQPVSEIDKQIVIDYFITFYIKKVTFDTKHSALSNLTNSECTQKAPNRIYVLQNVSGVIPRTPLHDWVIGLSIATPPSCCNS